MISICIPVYNCRTVELVAELEKQASAAAVPWEIILIDDCSSVCFRKENTAITGKSRYIQLDKNVGRSAIRNLFTEYASYEYLIFIDSDSSITCRDYINKYISIVKSEDPDVICGGRSYPETAPPRERNLRWRYGRARECLPATVRNLNPYRFFMSNNFLVRTSLFRDVPFDERLHGYGYEDTFFALMLKKRGVGILHTDNPVVHICTDTNREFISKTEQSIINLSRILEFTGSDRDFISYIRILSVHSEFGPVISALLTAAFKAARPLLRYWLRTGRAGLRVLDLYKLGLLSVMAGNKRRPLHDMQRPGSLPDDYFSLS